MARQGWGKACGAVEVMGTIIDDLTILYGEERAPGVAAEFDAAVARRVIDVGMVGVRWSEQDAVLITYGDTIRDGARAPLAVLGDFLDAHLPPEVISTVHVLPFSPWSSDDGFSVKDYRAVEPSLGCWADIERLGKGRRLMADLVLNHCSAESPWFQNYLAGLGPGRGWFVEADPGMDLSAVVRPRTHPLLTPVETVHGPRHVWTTFSADQVDLDFSNPAVLLEFVDVLLSMAARGVRVFRLDAVAFLWKEAGTNCLHRPEVYAVVRLLRAVLDRAVPGAWLITETNVPHEENVSYFGDGDAAQLVYNFSLPPLVLDAFLSHDASRLAQWVGGLSAPPVGCAFLNFTASHDGIGVRPLEGLAPSGVLDSLAAAVRRQGGLVSTRSGPGGDEVPYELNIAWVEALGGGDPETHAARVLASQAVPLALRGVPALYIHSLLGTGNDLASVRETGQPRAINRRHWTLTDLDEALSMSGSLQGRIFRGIKSLLGVRGRHPAFHPDGPQRVLPAPPAVLAIERRSARGDRPLVALTNVTDEPVSWSPPACGVWRDLLTGDTWSGVLGAYGIAWLVPAGDPALSMVRQL